MNVNKDLSALTTIPEKTLDKLNDKVLYVLCQGIQEDIEDEKDVSEFNFFDLFTLYIKHDGSESIKYKIVPTFALEKAVNATVKNKLNLLEDTLNASLARKFMEIYKDIC